MATKNKKNAQYKRNGGFVRRYHDMLGSPAYRDLRPAARCLLEEFQRIYRPSRNGFLSISTRDAAKLLKVSEPTAQKAFYDLASHGFIKLEEGHYWQQGKAREWRLTFEPFEGSEPTDDWRFWKPNSKKTPTKKTYVL